MSNILRVPAATAGSVPAAGTDYQKQNDSILRLVIARGDVFPVDFTNNKVVKGASFNVGGVFYYASADETITGTPSNYVKLTPISAGAQCSAVYVANLSGVSWSDTYNGYVDVSGNLYLFDEAKAFAAGAVSTPKTFAGKVFQNIPHGRTVIAVAGAGNYTVPSGVYWITVTTIGGGGGGSAGAGAGAGIAGQGGHSGNSNKTTIAVTPGQIIAYSVGAGGTPGTTVAHGGAAPGVGGTTTFTGVTSSAGGSVTGTGIGGGQGNAGIGGPGTRGSGTISGIGGGPGGGNGDGQAGTGMGSGGAGGQGGASVFGDGGAGAPGAIIVEW